MLFVEILRLFVAVGGALAGLAIGEHIAATTLARALGAGIGVLVGYVAGGITGRLADRGVRRADRSLGDVPAPELLSGVLIGGLGFLLGVVVCVPLFVYVDQPFDYVVAAAVAWVVGALGLRLGMAKGRQLADALGVTRRLVAARPEQRPGSDLADTSALMDRSFLVAGLAGLFGREVLVPEVVADELATIAAGPDPASSRRARRALEAIDSLRAAGVMVTFVQGDSPEATTTDERVAALADRIGARVVTCAASMTRSREGSGAPVLDLRRFAADLAPDHVPGEHLRVDLVRHGRQPRQAVGYLPDGDMVVVNDAEELVGAREVGVVVLSTRPTNQGLLVFARLVEAEEPSTAAL